MKTLLVRLSLLKLPLETKHLVGCYLLSGAGFQQPEGSGTWALLGEIAGLVGCKQLGLSSLPPFSQKHRPR